MEFEDTQFYVSSVTLRVARVGMQRTVLAWNHHPIPGMYRAIGSYVTQKPSHPDPASENDVVTKTRHLIESFVHPFQNHRGVSFQRNCGAASVGSITR